MLSALIMLAAAPLLASGQVQVDAICTPDFAWMNNLNGSSPCVVAAQVDSVCNNGNWKLGALNPSVKYNNPSNAAGDASLCTCSWASFNLISACITCQGFPEQTPFWSAYTVDCGGKLTNNYFPSNLTLPEAVTVPFWAGRNPTQWTNQKFDLAEAKTLQQQGHPDLGDVPPAKKSKPVGPIIGGVIGGLVVIGGAIALALYMIRRQKRALQTASSANSMVDSRPAHMRSISDSTFNSHLKPSSTYMTLSSSNPMFTNPPTSPTIRTHSTSVRSVPYASSAVASTAPYGSPSPPPARQMAASPSNVRPEDVIVPFTLPPTVDNRDRKQTNGEYPVYDPPSAPPPLSSMRMDIIHPQTPAQRARYNPPTYAESTPGGSGSGTPPRHRGKQGSTDTNHSLSSSARNGASPPTRQPTVQGHTPANSGSSMGNIAPGAGNTMTGIANGGENTTPQGYGRQVGPSRDLKRRPTEESFNGGDIA